MQITIDSSESLSKVTTVIGAVYGVELVVANGNGAPAASNGRRRNARSAPAKKSSGRAVGRPRKAAGRRGGSVDPSAVRQWAIAQGLTASTRGQLSKSVLEAYRQQHG